MRHQKIFASSEFCGKVCPPCRKLFHHLDGRTAAPTLTLRLCFFRFTTITVTCRAEETSQARFRAQFVAAQILRRRVHALRICRSCAVARQCSTGRAGSGCGRRCSKPASKWPWRPIGRLLQGVFEHSFVATWRSAEGSTYWGTSMSTSGRSSSHSTEVPRNRDRRQSSPKSPDSTFASISGPCGEHARVGMVLLEPIQIQQSRLSPHPASSSSAGLRCNTK